MNQSKVRMYVDDQGDWVPWVDRSVRLVPERFELVEDEESFLDRLLNWIEQYELEMYRGLLLAALCNIVLLLAK